MSENVRPLEFRTPQNPIAKPEGPRSVSLLREESPSYAPPRRNIAALQKESRMVDRIVRKSEAARLLGVSLTSLWRLETLGLIRAVSVLPGLAGFRESELQAFVESRERAEPNRARVEAALASPRHGRAGRAPQAVEA